MTLDTFQLVLNFLTNSTFQRRKKRGHEKKKQQKKNREVSHIYSSAEILTQAVFFAAFVCLFIQVSFVLSLQKNKFPEPVNVKQSEVMRRCSERAGIAVKISRALTSDHLPSGLYSF